MNMIFFQSVISKQNCSFSVLVIFVLLFPPAVEGDLDIFLIFPPQIRPR